MKTTTSTGWIKPAAVACLATAAAGLGLYGAFFRSPSDPPPPPPQTEVIMAQPSPDYVWVGGYWDWSWGHYAWFPGRWAAPPHPHAVWMAPRWDERGGRRVFVRGSWH